MAKICNAETVHFNRKMHAWIKSDLPNVVYTGTIFSGTVDSNNTVFSGRTDFTKAMFLENADFNDAAFKSATIFTNVKFSLLPPKFYNATLHEDTDWTGIRWPDEPEERQATESRRAYERLKLLMAMQNKFQDEHFFLRKELRCREIENPKIFYTFFSRLYRWTSGYGWSIRLPLGALGINWLVGWILIGAADGRTGCQCLDFWQSMGFSASNIFGFLGFDTYFFGDTIKNLNGFSRFISGLQIILGLVFIFLLALGIRNRFRIK